VRGETLNNFKKEITLIAVKLDESGNQQLSEMTARHLADILQKSDQEVHLILKRTQTQEKKKKRKQEMDKRRNLVSSFLEREVRAKNKFLPLTQSSMLPPQAE
jgi:mevalonate pyrophosphate decarboxylase